MRFEPTAAGSHLTVEIGGHQVVQHYTDPAAEYAAMRNGAALFDRSHRQRLLFTGKSAADALNGLVTNDVSHLTQGHGLYAAALTAKGKIVADLRIFRRSDDSFLVDCPARAAEGWLALVRKYVNPRLARHEDVSASLSSTGVFGPRAAAVLGEAGLNSDAIAGLDRHAMLECEWGGDTLMIASVPGMGVQGFDVVAQPHTLEQLSAALTLAGARSAGHVAWEIARVENGIPEWGVDMDDNTLAQEANLDRLHAISFTKGCYIGQETVARLHFRGHVNRQLRGLRFASVDVPPRGAEVFADSPDKPAGDVRSAAYSPRTGGVAIAMLRREITPGSSVTVRWADAECQAGVHEIPTDQSGA